jgi:hypothetical protein
MFDHCLLSFVSDCRQCGLLVCWRCSDRSMIIQEFEGSFSAFQANQRKKNERNQLPRRVCEKCWNERQKGEKEYKQARETRINVIEPQAPSLAILKSSVNSESLVHPSDLLVNPSSSSVFHSSSSSAFSSPFVEEESEVDLEHFAEATTARRPTEFQSYKVNKTNKNYTKLEENKSKNGTQNNLTREESQKKSPSNQAVPVSIERPYRPNLPSLDSSNLDLLKRLFSYFCRIEPSSSAYLNQSKWLKAMKLINLHEILPSSLFLIAFSEFAIALKFAPDITVDDVIDSARSAQPVLDWPAFLCSFTRLCVAKFPKPTKTNEAVTQFLALLDRSQSPAIESIKLFTS